MPYPTVFGKASYHDAASFRYHLPMRGFLETLGQRRLLLVTGKGGTGKSVVATSLARYYAEEGKHVWLVELGRRRDHEFSRLRELLGVSRLGHKPTTIPLPRHAKGQLEAARLDPAQSLAEYIALKIPGGALAGMLLKNNVTRSLLEVVPGLMEIVTLGKLWHSLTQKETPDLVIIDGAASGHAVTLLQSPKNFAKLTQRGPLYRDASAMESFLENSKQTGVIFVSLPEVTPLQEAAEFIKLLKKESDVPLLIVNKCMPEDDAPKKVPEWAEAAIQYRRRRRAHEQAALKETPTKVSTETLPLFFPPDSPVEQTLNYWRGNA